MGAKQRKTLWAVFEEPVKAQIKWADVETMLRALGAEISEGSGSRVRVRLRGARAVFHRPHPETEAGKSRMRDVRTFLENAGVTSDEL